MLSEGLGLDFRITTAPEEFTESAEPKINYSELPFEDAFAIKPHTILFDHGIRDYHLQVNTNAQFEKIFFKNSTHPVPFDLFGAAFWLLSRYEEYLPHKGDQYNRFNFKSSLAYQYEFLHYPLVNVWLSEFQKLLAENFPDLEFKKRTYNFISTIDIDNVYKYKNKGFVRTLAGLISDRNFAKIKQRMRIILGKEKDPFDCYEFLIDAHKQTETKAIYFFLLGDYGPNDKNHSSSDLRFQSLIKHLADYSMVGVHPSFGSNNNLRQLKVETSRLGNITHKLITKTRQHFSMLTFPLTYKDLLQAGLTADYSMGYKNANGFRSSYCYPYKWYSLDIESVSSLTIHSFAITENNLLAQEKEGKSLVDLANPLVNEVKKYNGELISIFHNDVFTTKMKLFYIEFLNLVKKN
ncbi:hypothetical protein CNR22_22050 [Sphingobacteriaceae bacterium]|nr:hypothetical protein CNR22_22050 [Sphingobacteriaceae bacterium]